MTQTFPEEVETVQDACWCGNVRRCLEASICTQLSLQDENLDIVGGIKNILKSSKSQKSLAEQDPLQWSTVCSRIQEENSDQAQFCMSTKHCSVA